MFPTGWDTGAVTDLDARYGRRTRPRWVWPVVAAIGITIGVAFAAWVGFQDKPVSARVWAYDVQGEHAVTITLDVATDEPIPLRCTVYAQAHDHSIVGEKTVDLEPSTEDERRVAIDVETERRAVTGVLRACEPAS